MKKKQYSILLSVHGPIHLCKKLEKSDAHILVYRSCKTDKTAMLHSILALFTLVLYKQKLSTKSNTKYFWVLIFTFIKPI